MCSPFQDWSAAIRRDAMTGSTNTNTERELHSATRGLMLDQEPNVAWSSFVLMSVQSLPPDAGCPDTTIVCCRIAMRDKV